MLLLAAHQEATGGKVPRHAAHRDQEPAQRSCRGPPHLPATVSRPEQARPALTGACCTLSSAAASLAEQMHPNTSRFEQPQPQLPDVDAQCKLQQPAPCQPCSLQPASLALLSVPSCSNLQSGFRVQTLNLDLPARLLCLLRTAAACTLPALLSRALHTCPSVGTSDSEACFDDHVSQFWKHVLVRSF